MSRPELCARMYPEHNQYHFIRRSMGIGWNYFPNLKLHYWRIFNFCHEVGRTEKKKKKTNVAMVDTASATAEKQKWRILNPRLHRVKNVFF